MFGYFRPYDSNLTANQLKTFRAYYCRLCCGLRSMGGQRARYLTTFDATIYYMISNMSAGAATPTYFRCQKLSKKGMRISEKDELAMKFVHCVLIAIGEKMRDDYLDGDKSKARFIRVMYGKAIKAAQKDEAALTKAAYDGTERINHMQENNAPIDELLNAYGDIVYDTISCVNELGTGYAELCKSIAAWTFYIDVLCDYDSDYAKDKFNPLKKDGVPTLRALFDTEYQSLHELNAKVCNRVIAALTAVKDGSSEWHTLHKILVHALSTVAPNIFDGQDVKFRYFKELTKNFKLMKNSRRRFDEANDAATIKADKK